MTTAAHSRSIVPKRSVAAYIALVERAGEELASGWKPVTLKIQGHELPGFARKPELTVLTGIATMRSRDEDVPSELDDLGMRELEITGDNRTIRVALTDVQLHDLNQHVH